MAHPSLQTRCCAVILAGGRNTRMEGRNKAFLKVGGRTILERMIAILTPLLGRPLLVTRAPERYASYPVRVVEDIHSARSSLTGIHAGLVHADTDYAFVVPCDAPFLRPALVEALVAEITPAVDVVVPWVNGFYEPLCAIYAKRCLPAIEARLRQGSFKITGFYDKVRVKTVTAEKLQSADGRMASFFNVNTPDALEASRDLLDED